MINDSAIRDSGFDTRPRSDRISRLPSQRASLLGARLRHAARTRADNWPWPRTAVLLGQYARSGMQTGPQRRTKITRYLGANLRASCGKTSRRSSARALPCWLSWRRSSIRPATRHPLGGRRARAIKNAGPTLREKLAKDGAHPLWSCGKAKPPPAVPTARNIPRRYRPGCSRSTGLRCQCAGADDNGIDTE